MKIRIVSDLHLEFNNFLYQLPGDKDTVLVLAGDVGVAKKSHTYKYFIEQCSDDFRAVIFICGNHEHYQGSIDRSKDKIEKACLEYDNVHVLENETCIIDDVAFVCATLWSNFDNLNPVCMYDAQLKMNDFKIIRTGPPGQRYQRKLKPNDVASIHLKSKFFVFEEIRKHKADGKKVVVVTHHGPSYLSVPEMFKGDILNGAYVSEFYYDIINDPYDLHIHGHTHTSFDYMIGDTRVLCNPRGYFPSDLNPNYDENLTIEL